MRMSNDGGWFKNKSSAEGVSAFLSSRTEILMKLKLHGMTT